MPAGHPFEIILRAAQLLSQACLSVNRIIRRLQVKRAALFLCRRARRVVSGFNRAFVCASNFSDDADGAVVLWQPDECPPVAVSALLPEPLHPAARSKARKSELRDNRH